jgi:putative toxin-antitoxin system antitoxin component (TIGR02293 family)
MPQTLAKTLHLQIGDTLPDMIAAARRGVPMRALEALVKAMSITLQDMADILPVSYRTLKRYPHDHVLDKDLSAHVLELGRVFVRAIETFGNEERARKWLSSSSQALGGATPLSMLDTTLGAEAVLDELVRIEHGVYY